MNTLVSRLPKTKPRRRLASVGALSDALTDCTADMPLGEALVAAGLLRREDLEGSLTKQISSRRRLCARRSRCSGRTPSSGSSPSG